MKPMLLVDRKRHALKYSIYLALAASVISGSFLNFSNPALAVCSSSFLGRWANEKQNDDPGFIEVRFSQCGDTEGSQTSIGVRVCVLPSTGQWYCRPEVVGKNYQSKGVEWLYAEVPTGGYVDKMWMREWNGGLAVFIRHQSLDAKPSAEEWHTYKKK